MFLKDERWGWHLQKSMFVMVRFTASNRAEIGKLAKTDKTLISCLDGMDCSIDKLCLKGRYYPLGKTSNDAGIWSYVDNFQT